MTCSILILTRNEEINIADCIKSVQFSDDIVVFDSMSDDKTVELAHQLGARVIQHEFVNYGSQREAARTLVDYRYPWVLALDADERVEADLVGELQTVLSHARQEVAFRLRRKDYFRGKWIKHATLYPSWHLRLYRPDKVRYPARAVHEYPEVEGIIGSLNGHLSHNNFSKGLGQWWQRHIRYAELEALEMKKSAGDESVSVSTLLSNDPVVRRRGLKALSYQLPFRPELRYLYMMLLRGGVLDGPAGWEYCRMIAAYQRITDQLAKGL